MAKRKKPTKKKPAKNLADKEVKAFIKEVEILVKEDPSFIHSLLDLTDEERDQVVENMCKDGGKTITREQFDALVDVVEIVDIEEREKETDD